MAQNAGSAAKKADEAITRPLNAREIRWARTVFGTALDYKQVKIHNTRAYLTQSRGYAVTPNGEIYFTKFDYRPDFSNTVGNMSWLIHELTHAWQSQNSMWIRLRYLLNHNYQYGDLSKSTTPFLSLGVEQQAAIVEDYFRIIHGAKPRNGSGSRDDYVRMIPFCRNTEHENDNPISASACSEHFNRRLLVGNHIAILWCFWRQSKSCFASRTRTQRYAGNLWHNSVRNYPIFGVVGCMVEADTTI